MKLLNRDHVCILILLVAAVILYTFNLGELPLRDWDEGIVAGVARNIWRSSADLTWLYPTINYDQPYWNKPPLIHGLIALSYNCFGVREWSTRIVPALLSACSVPLLYQIGREIFNTRLAALLSALIYLTLLPVARHSRVAMLDGAIACWFCLAIWCLLRGRKHSGWLLGTGLGIGLICLTKGIMMGVLLGGIALLFILWDSPRLIFNPYLWGGLALGIIPAIAWYWMQYLHYGEQFLGISLGKQTFNRIWQPVSDARSPIWYYLLEIIKYSLPWLIFLPNGVKLACHNLHQSWAKLALIWSGVYLLAISLMVTKLPWYIIPLYPGLSLLIGASLANAIQTKKYPSFWQISLGFVAIIIWLATIYYAFIGTEENRDLSSILVVLALSLTLASVLISLSSRYFLAVTIAGFYLTLLLLFNSRYWLWELSETFPVQPIAANIKQYTPARETIYTSYPNLRPALEFYSDRLIIPASDAQIKQYWQTTTPIYLLVNQSAIARLNLNPHITLGKKANNVEWQIITNQ